MTGQQQSYLKRSPTRTAFICVLIFLVVAEMAYDGDFTLVQDVPSQALRQACVDAFRSHFLEGSFIVDMTPTASNYLLEGMDVEKAKLILLNNGYTISDVTDTYRNSTDANVAAQFRGNNQVLVGSRTPDYFLLPPVITDMWSRQFCDIEVFINNSDLTNVRARAVRASY